MKGFSVRTTPRSTLTAQKTSRPWLLPALGMTFALLMMALGLYFAVTNNRTDNVTVWARPVMAGQQIVREDLAVIALPVQRPDSLAVVHNVDAVVGMWSTRSVGSNELVSAAQVQVDAPTVPFYPSGESLPTGMVALPFSIKSVGPVTERDTINVNFVDRTGDPTRCAALGGTPLPATVVLSTTAAPAPMTGDPFNPALTTGLTDSTGQPIAATCRLIPQLNVLYVDSAAQIAFLAATPYQSQAVYTLAGSEDVTLYGERYGATAPTLPYLTRLDPASINATLLTGMVTETTPLLPGVRAVVPGTPATPATTTGAQK